VTVRQPILLLCGGPFAGRVLQWHETPPMMNFPVLKNHSGWLSDDEGPPNSEVIQPTVVQYRRGHSALIAAGQVWAYHFVGEDKYRTARTLEHLVEFAAPYSLAEIHDRVEVDFLLVTMGLKP